MGGLYNPTIAVDYADDEIVGKINTALAKITRANAIEIAAILESETKKLILATEQAKLAGIEDGAQVNPLNLAELDSVANSKLVGIEVGAEVNPADLVALDPVRASKLDAIETGAQVNPPDLATLDPVADTRLATVETRLSAYEAGILPPGAIEATYSATGYDVIRVFQPVGLYSFVIASQLGDVGFTSSGYYAGGASMRFKANIPKGAIIKRAYIVVTAGMTTPTGSIGIVRSEMAVEDTANATQITSQNDFYARPRIAIAWDNIPLWVVSAQYNSPSIVTLIQRVIDKPSWEKDNAIQIFWDDRLDRSEHVSWSSRQLWLVAAVAAKYPKLYVAYVMP